MRKVSLGIVLLTLALTVPILAMAEVSVNIDISLPPLIEFSAPPELIVLPGTYVYVAPDVNEDIFFYGGWWWRPWEGHWYRSRNYGSGWSSYRSVPSFYREIPSGWRDDYREHRWQGRQWNHQQLPYQQVQRNWKGWQDNRHWEKQQTWGVQGLQSQPRTPQPSREMQSRPSRSPSREFNQERSPQRGTPDRGQVEQRERKTTPPPSQNIQSQKSQPQSREARGHVEQQERRTAPQRSQEVRSPQPQQPSREAKPKQSQQHGKQDGGGEDDKDKHERK